MIKLLSSFHVEASKEILLTLTLEDKSLIFFLSHKLILKYFGSSKFNFDTEKVKHNFVFSDGLQLRTEIT